MAVTQDTRFSWAGPGGLENWGRVLEAKREHLQPIKKGKKSAALKSSPSAGVGEAFPGDSGNTFVPKLAPEGLFSAAVRAWHSVHSV